MTALVCSILALAIGWFVGSRRASAKANPEPAPAASVTSAIADLRPLLDSLPDPVLLIDSTDRVSLLNSAASTFLQLGAAATVGRPFVSVTTDQSLLDLFDAARNHEAQRAAQRELKVTRGGNRLTFQALALRNPDRSVLILLRDVTRLSDIVQMKTDFVSNASHELRTPVSAMKLALETMAEDPADGFTRDHCLKIVRAQLSRLEEMLTDLMDLSKIESADLATQLRPIPPSEIFAGLSVALAPLAKAKNLQLTFVGPDDDAPLNTDWRLLSLVLKNLVENAIKFTPQGSITTAIATAPGGGFTATVADTGIGIPEEHHARIFERFYQVDPARTGSSARGTGLGLAIVKHAVQRLGGTVTLRSQVGKGTTIICTFG